MVQDALRWMARRAIPGGPYIRGDLEVAVEPADGDDIELQFMVGRCKLKPVQAVLKVPGFRS